MADKRPGRSSRPRAGRGGPDGPFREAGEGRPAPGDAPAPAGRPGGDAARAAAAAAAEVERAITALEELVLSGRADQIPRWTAVLWNHRAETQRALLRRLENGPVRVPSLLLEVLVGLSGGRATAILRRVAANSEVADLVRLEARRRSGWPARGERRARGAFLRTLHDPLGALHTLVALGCGVPGPDGEAFEEALGYVLALPAAERATWMARVSGLHGDAVSWLLRALLSAPDGATREAAVEELLGLRDRGAAAALDRLARCRYARGGRTAARVAARRLTLRALQGGAERRRTRSARPSPKPQEPPAFEEALVTGVDGKGGQAVTIIRAWNDEVRLVVQLMLRDDGGVTGVHGAMRVAREHTVEMLRLSGLPDAPVVRVSLEEARSQVAWAVERRLAAGHLPPAAFTLWEPYLWEDLCPQVPAPGAPVGGLALAGSAEPPAPERVTELLRSGFCESWQFSVQELAPVLRDLADGDTSGAARYATLLSRLCPPPVRSRLAERLRRQAWVLDRSGRPELRDAALGCACGLETLAPEELDAMPLLRGMLARGLAGLRPRHGRRRG